MAKKNKAKNWKYGYDEKYDIIVISKDGTVGDIYEVQGLKIGLPKTPSKYYSNEEKCWQPFEYPKSLSKIKSIFQWNEMSSDFKDVWVGYIEQEFDKRDEGFWFNNNGNSTYITGTHYCYLQWTKIDVGHPDFRESKIFFFIFWEAFKSDKRIYGMCYLKNRSYGFSFM